MSFSRRLITSLFLLGVITSGCSSTPEERIDNALDQAYENTEKEKTNYLASHSGGAPVEVIAERYQTLMDQYGPNEYVTGYDAQGKPDSVFAWYLKETLELDDPTYVQLAYIKYESGTYGLQTILEAMDSNATGVKEAEDALREYHDLTDYDPSYYQSRIDMTLGAQEQAAAELQLLSNSLSQFYPTAPLYGTYQTDVDTIANLSGLDREQLAMVAANANLQRFAELLPDTLEYKTQIIDILNP